MPRELPPINPMRWGPSLEHDLPSIDIPRDWRATVAELPHEQWQRWRQRASELEQVLGTRLTPEQIRECGRQAAEEMGIPTKGPKP